MTSAERMRNKKLGHLLVQQLQSRNFEAEYCDNAVAAKKKVMSMISKEDSVGFGGSITLEQCGIMDELRNGTYNIVDRDTAKTPEEKQELMRKCLSTDIFLMSANAISEDGQIVNIDGVGNRVAALCYGPKTVIMVIGVNKVARTLEDAMSRARYLAAPVNAQRFPISTPCIQTGVCGNCKRTDSICSQIVVTRLCRPAGRIKVIIVGENLGL